jgi:chemotaxis protein CheX
MSEISLEQMGTFAAEALAEMMQTMFEVPDAAPADARVVQGALPDTALTAFIGLAGEWTGGVAVHCSAELARTLAARMLMTDDLASLSEDDVRDAMGEICNMVTGGLKTRCQGIGVDFNISVPVIVLAGEPTHVHYRMTSQLCVIETKLEGEPFSIRLAMARDERGTRA